MYLCGLAWKCWLHRFRFIKAEGSGPSHNAQGKSAPKVSPKAGSGSSLLSRAARRDSRVSMNSTSELDAGRQRECRSGAGNARRSEGMIWTDGHGCCGGPDGKDVHNPPSHAGTDAHDPAPKDPGGGVVRLARSADCCVGYQLALFR